MRADRPVIQVRGEGVLSQGSSCRCELIEVSVVAWLGMVEKNVASIVRVFFFTLFFAVISESTKRSTLGSDMACVGARVLH